MKPSEALALKRDQLAAIVARYPTTNLRVYGSVVHGKDQDNEELDLLVDALPGATLFHLGGLYNDLEELLGVPVCLLTPPEVPIKYRSQVLAEARPV
ncbi:nucleotidyltransferase family protein [Mitsuaria sp. 7]|uniref:nucleotidyltransferase family protein n=1 Tax=Mitsuaria sp. 7 TaxID=1658665 RepID=UPI0007DD0376|nr:nucleotidyltransferase family protein [Mitsuaria sp. 7]ANH68833.1 DNA polymerase [Mitsuaria sp. 7]